MILALDFVADFALDLALDNNKNVTKKECLVVSHAIFAADFKTVV